MDKKQKNTKPQKTKAKSSASKKSEKTAVNFELVSVCLVGLCIYLLICIFSGGSSGGIVGRWIYNFLTGLMGTCAYILPLMTIALFIYAIFFAVKDKIKKKFILSYCLLYNIGGILQMSFAHDVPANEWFAKGMSGEISGGILGGTLITILRCLGDAGAYIILYCALIVFVVLVFNISLADIVSVFKSIFISSVKEEKKPKSLSKIGF